MHSPQPLSDLPIVQPPLPFLRRLKIYSVLFGPPQLPKKKTLLELLTEKSRPLSRWNELRSCEDLDYPEVWTISFCVSEVGLRKLVEPGHGFPNRCCVCGGKAERRLAGTHYDFICDLRVYMKWRQPVLVPYCAEHGQGRGQFVVNGPQWVERRPCVVIGAYGRSPEFLREWADALTTGEYLPPWVARPDSLPFIQWNQRAEEWLYTFRDFWGSLSDQQRESYLQRWPPPTADWREAMEPGENSWMS